jgi:hypothetical protein
VAEFPALLHSAVNSRQLNRIKMVREFLPVIPVDGLNNTYCEWEGPA